MSEEQPAFWIRIERGASGLLYATSPNLKGLLVAEDSMEKLCREIPKAISDLRTTGADTGLIE